MLNLSFLKSESPRVIPGSQFQRVEETTRVLSLLGVEVLVPIDLSTAHSNHLNRNKLGHGEGKSESQVGGAIQLNLASLLPSNAGGAFRNKHAKASEHGPTAVDELALPKASYAEGVAIRDKGVGRQLLVVHIIFAGDGSILVFEGLEVVLVKANLQILRGLAQTKGIEATITRERAVQPGWSLSSWKPKSIPSILPVALTTRQPLSSATRPRCRRLLKSLRALLDSNGLGGALLAQGGQLELS